MTQQVRRRRKRCRIEYVFFVSLSIFVGIQLWLANKQKQAPVLSFQSALLEYVKRIEDNAIPNLVCGARWAESLKALKNAPKRPADKPLVWTVSGGDEYRAYLKPTLEQWKSIGLSPLLVVAMDQETAAYVCGLGYQAVLWDEPPTSYSRVADSKFEVGAVLAEVGMPAFFMEVDVFCKKNPLPLFINKGGLVVTGHGYADFVPNIGQYYVEPKQEIADFFRSVRAVLRYSQDNKEYSVNPGKGGRVREFFDQHQFYRCLPPTNPFDVHYNASHGMYLLPPKKTENLLAICRNVTHTTPFPWSSVSNVYISAHNPPTLLDSTICIHPLSDAPFSSFRLKLATAQFMGYDPEPILPQDKFLKTVTGDLTLNECWGFPFFGDETFRDNHFIHDKFTTFLGHLILLAQKTGRTLVMPRYFRDINAFAVPILSLVDIRSIEQHVRVKYISQPNELTPKVILLDTDHKELLQRIDDAADEPVVAIDRMCDVFRYVGAAAEAKAVGKTLSLCVTDPRIKFTKSIGSWSRICDSYNRPPPSGK